MVSLLPPLPLDAAPTAVSVVALAVGAAVLVSRLKTSATNARDAKVRLLPDSWPVLGDLVTLARNEARFHDWLAKTCLHFRGEPWRIRVAGQTDTVVVSRPEAFEAVLATQFSEFPNGDLSNLVLSGVFGRSIMTLDGEDWYRQRKAAAKFFTARALRVCMLQTMHKNVHQMFETLDASAASGASVNLSKLLDQFTLQTFAEIALGVNLRYIGETTPSPLEDAARVASAATMRRFRIPVFWWKLERALGVGPEGQMADAMTTVRDWVGGVIDQSLAEFAKRHERVGNNNDNATVRVDATEVKSLLELYFQHVQNEHADDEGLRAEDLVDFILTFVVTAQDTSALTLSRFFLVLAQHPAIEARIRDEMDRELAASGVSQDAYLTTDHLHHLVFLEATMRETLRLYSTVPLMQKEAGQDTVICGDIPIAKGEQVCLASYAMARNPDVWGPDAAAFKPDRWIDSKTGALVTVPASKFPAFSTGPRACIGMKLATMEIRVVAANLLRQYRFALAEPNDGAYVVGITLSLKRPVCVNVTRAAQAAVT